MLLEVAWKIVNPLISLFNSYIFILSDYVHTGDKGNKTSVIYSTFLDLSMKRMFYRSHFRVVKSSDQTSEPTHCHKSLLCQRSRSSSCSLWFFVYIECHFRCLLSSAIRTEVCHLWFGTLEQCITEGAWSQLVFNSRIVVFTAPPSGRRSVYMSLLQC